MIWYLLREVKKEEKGSTLNSFKRVLLIKYMFIFIPISLFNGYAIYKNNAMITFIVLVIFGISTYVFIYNHKKSLEKTFGSDYERYKKRIDIIRDVLIKMELYSAEKVKYIIDLNNERKKNWKFSESISKPFATILTTVLIPTITLLLKWIFDHANITNDVIKYAGIVVTIILLLLGLVYLFKPILENYLDKEYLEFESLQNMLEDIFLIDFLDGK